jgi:hypothetical protein
MNEKPVKNFAARESNWAITAGMYHWKPPQIWLCAEVTKIGVRAPRVPIIGRAKYWLYPASLFLLNRPKSGMLTAMLEKRPMMTLRAVNDE